MRRVSNIEIFICMKLKQYARYIQVNHMYENNITLSRDYQLFSLIFVESTINMFGRTNSGLDNALVAEG